MKTFRSLLAAVAACALTGGMALVAGPSAAAVAHAPSALEVTVQDAPTNLETTDGSTASDLDLGSLPVTSAPKGSDEVRAELESLARTQTPELVERIAASGRPAEFLFDPVAGELLAGVLVDEPSVAPFAITPVGPGCSTTSACLRNSSGTNFGYQGSGTLTGNWANIVYVAAGNLKSRWTVSTGLQITQSPNAGFHMAAVKITKLERFIVA